MRVSLANPKVQALAWLTCLSSAYLLTLPIYRGLTAMDDALARLRTPPSAETYLVAKAELPIGHLVTPLDLDWGQTPGFVPPGTLQDVDRVLGRSVRERILPGEAVRLERFSPHEGNGLAALIPPGGRAVTVRLTDADRVSGFVEAGDRVDLLVTFADGASANTKTILQNVVVLALNDQLAGSPLGTTAPKAQVTLLVTPDGANRLTHGLNIGVPRLVLRPDLADGADPMGPPWQPPGEPPAPLSEDHEDSPELAKRRAALTAFRQWVEMWPLTGDERHRVRRALANAERSSP